MTTIDELIRELINHFVRQYHRTPEVMYLGMKEYRELRNEASQYLIFDQGGNQEYAYGLEVEELMCESHIGFGFKVKGVDREKEV